MLPSVRRCPAVIRTQFWPRRKFPGVTVVDSMNLTTGIGYLAVAAAKMAEAGMEPEVIATKLENLKTCMDVSFVIDKLDYLRKGGLFGGYRVRRQSAEHQAQHQREGRGTGGGQESTAARSGSV